MRFMNPLCRFCAARLGAVLLLATQYRRRARPDFSDPESRAAPRAKEDRGRAWRLRHLRASGPGRRPRHYHLYKIGSARGRPALRHLHGLLVLRRRLSSARGDLPICACPAPGE